MARSPELRSLRTSRVLALGVALPTLLLALGWGYATLRERELYRRAEEARLNDELASFELGVTESLSELANRESQRPHYVWGHYYSPPDVLSLTDPVAVSPLVMGTGDARIVGHFQIAADGTVTTPYAVGPLDAREENARLPLEVAVATALEPSVRVALAGRLTGQPADALDGIADGMDPTEPYGWFAGLGTRSNSTTSSGSSAWGSASTETPTAADPLALNTYGSQLAGEIAQAQQGNDSLREELYRRGRVVPQVVRTDNIVEPQAAPQMTQQLPPSARVLEENLLHDTTRATIEVEYTPMEIERRGGALVLVRTVGAGPNAFVQGALFDENYLVNEWLSTLLSRFVVDAPVHIVRREDVGSCSRVHAISSVPVSAVVCIDAAALGAARIPWITWLEWSLLAFLLAIIGIAIVAIERVSRRERELSVQKSRFVSAVSHELRTPLTTIRMHAEMLADDLVDETRRPRVHEELVSETVRLSRLVENVLEASRIEEGRRPLRTRPLDLGAHVRGIADDMRRFVEGKGFTLTCEAPEDELIADVDPGAIEQVVVNLIDNAVKYGGGERRAIQVRIQKQEGQVILDVEDEGRGVPKDELTRVLERFHRVERVEQAHQPGTGLGLAIVKELVHAHGGTVALSNRVPHGLRVRVTLPRVIDGK
jgi:signal transduction histidine kinase